MQRTNYDSIAERFDEDRKDWQVPVEAGLMRMASETRSPIRVLDLGCGTGNWLATQASRLDSPMVSWIGIDPSHSMLAVARRKVPFARLSAGKAESIPVAADSCSYTAINFAFHHFVEKERALDEVSRVLRYDGLISVYTPQPDEMRNQWVYRFFEGTWELDQTRFWPADRIRSALEKRGYTVKEEWDLFKTTRTFSEILRRSELRVISELADIDDSAYLRGMEKIRRLASDDPDATYENESAMVRIEATRAG